MSITWTTPPDASVLHTAIAVEQGLPIVDEPLGEAMQAALDGWDRAALLAAAGPVAAGPVAAGAVAAGRASGLAEAFYAARGTTADGQAEEIRLRSRPLREQWDARGPGLLAAIERLTEPGLIAPRATVALVAPVVGGHGVALPRDRAVMLEAVLANPSPHLPEVVRLAWLLAQLRDEPLTAADHLALLPAVLAAAEEVELAECSESAIIDAQLAWRVFPPTHREPAELWGERLWRWWQEYCATPVPWRAALAAGPFE